MLYRAKDSGYNFDNIVSFLKEEEKMRLDNLYFKKKYRLDINNNLSEIEIADPAAEFLKVFLEIKKELKKGELLRIEKDLKRAEEKKDTEASGFLKNQFMVISKELFELEKWDSEANRRIF